MRTSTLKQLLVSILVGLIFGVVLSVSRFAQEGFLAGIGQFLYFFILLGGTFFITGLLFNRRGKDTANMRIFATKMEKEGILVMDEIAEMPIAGKKNIKGWLYLTDSLIIFANTPDAELIEKKAMRIPLSKIIKVETFKPTFITHDGIRLTLKNGQQHDILVGKTQKWVDAIIEEAEKRQRRKIQR